MKARLALGLVLLALAARMIVPAGFMPMATAHGAVIVPCSGAGPMTMAMPMAGQPHGAGHDDGDRPDHSCPFAALADFATGGHAPPPLPTPLPLTTPILAASFAQQAPALPDRLRPPLRAPPR